MRSRWRRWVTSSARWVASRCGRPAGSSRVTARPASGRRNSSGVCASILTRCATRTPITVQTRRLCYSATFRSGERIASTLRARPSSPACRTTSWRTRSRTRCSTAFIRASTSRATRTCWHFTRYLPTLWRSSSTSPIRACCATRSHARAATSPARACTDSSPSSSAVRPGGARQCVTHWARRERVSGNGSSPMRPRLSRSPQTA